MLYNEINFNYINKTYMENNNGELDNLLLANDSDEEDFWPYFKYVYKKLKY